MDLIIQIAPDWALPYVYFLTPEQWRVVGYSLLAIWIAGCTAFAVYCALRAFGWQRFKGRWYSPVAFSALV